MRLDPELIRRILLAAEQHERFDTPALPAELAGEDAAKIIHHIRLLLDRRLVDGSVRETMGSSVAMVKRLTWDGHEFLDNARNDQVWKRVTADVAKKGGSISFDFLLALLKAKAREHFGIDLS